jgi:protein O-mannosyl-transferase
MHMKAPGNQTNLHPEMEGVLRTDHVFVLALLLCVALVYAQTLGFQFLFWDDHVHLLSPPMSQGLTIAGVKSAFTSQLMNHWHPLTIMTYMLDTELFGSNPGAHHAVNALLHVLNSLLLFALLKSASRALWPSALATALWALHPLHVENVAWLSDLKDLLCTLFGLLALLAYVRFTRCRRWYSLVLLCYCLGMLSKSMIITLPVMCLLLDVWPLQRLALDSRGHAGFSHDILAGVEQQRSVPVKVVMTLFREKALLFLVALVFVLFTYATTQRLGGVEYYGRVGLWGRLTNSVCSHMWYIAKTIWPSAVTGHYIHPSLPGGIPWQAWQIAGSVLALLAISWAVWRLRRPYLVMGWLWFLLTLAPVNGMVQYGNPSRAGRYMYLPMIGLLIMFSWGLDELSQRCALARRHVTRKLVMGALVMVVLALAAASWVEAGYWRNDLAFCERQIELVPNNPYQNHNLALTYYELGRYKEAKYHAQKAVDVWPKLFQSHDLLATIYGREGNSELCSYHRSQASAIRMRMSDEHGKAISESVFAETANKLLTAQR